MVPEGDYCLRVGGEAAIVSRLEPIFRSLAPRVATLARTPGRTGKPSTSDAGKLRSGPNGAGDFGTMVHNGIEFGGMAALAQGLIILAAFKAGKGKREEDAETTRPLHPALDRCDIGHCCLAAGGKEEHAAKLGSARAEESGGGKEKFFARLEAA
jgi:6-phosphogluconate dehydrogenase